MSLDFATDDFFLLKKKRDRIAVCSSEILKLYIMENFTVFFSILESDLERFYMVLFIELALCIVCFSTDPVVYYPLWSPTYVGNLLRRKSVCLGWDGDTLPIYSSWDKDLKWTVLVTVRFNIGQSLILSMQLMLSYYLLAPIGLGFRCIVILKNIVVTKYIGARV